MEADIDRWNENISANDIESKGNTNDTRGAVIDIFPGAAQPFPGKCKTLYEKMRTEHEFAAAWDENPFYPFAGKIDWVLAKWMADSNLPLAHLNKFMKGPYVCLNRVIDLALLTRFIPGKTKPSFFQERR